AVTPKAARSSSEKAFSRVSPRIRRHSRASSGTAARKTILLIHYSNIKRAMTANHHVIDHTKDLRGVSVELAQPLGNVAHDLGHGRAAIGLRHDVIQIGIAAPHHMRVIHL